MKITRAINGDEIEFDLTADEIRAAHEEFIYPNYIASIESLGLNLRCLNSLSRYGIESITQLVQEINNGHIRYFRNLGAVSIRAVCAALDARNIPYDRNYIAEFL